MRVAHRLRHRGRECSRPSVRGVGHGQDMAWCTSLRPVDHSNSSTSVLKLRSSSLMEHWNSTTPLKLEKKQTRKSAFLERSELLSSAASWHCRLIVQHQSSSLKKSLKWLNRV
eukprot:4253522-Amphidinium_carterae.1